MGTHQLLRRARLLLPASIVLLPLLTAFCASGHGKSTDEFDPNAQVAGSGPLEVRVNNYNWSEVVVYAVYGTQLLRLGNVLPDNAAAFPIKPDQVAAKQLTLRVHPLGGARDYVSSPIPVGGAQRVELRVEKDLGQTSWTVF